MRHGRAIAALLALLLPGLALLACGTPQREEPRVLRVCADPNNLPFSNDRGEGFENRLAVLLAADLDARLEYIWRPQRRGFIRSTLGAGVCDVVMGIPADVERVLPTRPYYRSSYVFLSRRDDPRRIVSLDDSLLHRMRVGVHLIGDDYHNTPPAHALARRRVVANVVGYTIYGNYAEPNPPARIVEAVASGRIDLAVVWGPFAGYFAPRQAVPLRLAPVRPEQDGPDLPFTFAIALGVRRDAPGLRDRLDAVLARRGGEIDRLLDEYGIPRLTLTRQMPDG